MLIDSNSYVGHWPFRQLQGSNCRGLLDRMNRHGIDVSLVSNLNGVFYKNTQNANEELYNEIRSEKQFADRIIPFAVINPVYSGWKNDLEVCHKKLGMQGVRLYPKYHRYELDHPNCIELVRIARDRGLPVALSLRMVDSRTSSWLDVEKEWALKDILPIIKAVSDAKYLILNIANSTAMSEYDLDWFKKTDLIMDTSGRGISDLGQLIARFGKEKFAFGTHAPILDDRTGLLRIEAMRDSEADTQTKSMLKSGNARRFLKL
ncbi:amidohydrolase family protein [Persicitalea sp.]|uniref:amidohydrolase family protein n=1 Tax=Persicitalea sp. TaxID=3100273 RepID=UPI0035945132